MNVIDRIVEAFSPTRAVERSQARMMLDQLEKIRAYEGAKSGRRTAGWTVSSASANAEIMPALNKLRDRSRDMYRNNPWARRGINVLVRAMVGSGVTPKFQNERTSTLWDQWQKQCDADGTTNFAGIIELAEKTRREAGECLIRFRPRRSNDGLEVPLQLQVLEPDHLDTYKNETLVDGGYIQAGIQFNVIGQRVGYWIYPDHPGEFVTTFFRANRQSVFIPASEIIHYYKRERPSQVRGIPELSTVLMGLRDLDDYRQALLVKKKIESCFTAFVTRNEDISSSISSNSENRLVEKLAPGMITRLMPGESVEFAAPSSDGGADGYLKSELRAIAAGLGITYEQLTGDLSEVNYSSLRAGLLGFTRMIEADQWNLMIPGLLQPIMNRWIAVAIIAKGGALVSPVIDWTMPKQPSTDPLKEVLASKEEIKGGGKSISEWIRERGSDPQKVFEEISKERQALSALGLVFDTDMAMDPKVVKAAIEDGSKKTQKQREEEWELIQRVMQSVESM